MDHKEAREKLKMLEQEVTESQDRLAAVRKSKEKTSIDHADAKNRLAEAEKSIETALDGIARGMATAEDLKAARQSVRDIQAEIGDLESIIGAYRPVEAHAAEEVNTLRGRLTAEKKLFWASVSQELEIKLRKVTGNLLREVLAAKQLAGWIAFSPGDLLGKIFFDDSIPQLNEEKASLTKKYINAE